VAARPPHPSSWRFSHREHFRALSNTFEHFDPEHRCFIKTSKAPIKQKVPNRQKVPNLQNRRAASASDDSQIRGLTLMRFAAELNSIELMESVLSTHVVSSTHQAIAAAAAKGACEAVAWLLERGAPIDGGNGEALCLAVQSGHGASGMNAACRLLLSKGASLSIANYRPLRNAVVYGSQETVAALLRESAARGEVVPKGTLGGVGDGDDEGASLIGLATQFGRVEIVAVLDSYAAQHRLSQSMPSAPPLRPAPPSVAPSSAAPASTHRL